MRRARIALAALAAGALIAGSAPAIAKSGKPATSSVKASDVRAGTKVGKAEKGDAPALPFILTGIVVVGSIIAISGDNGPSSP